jgi:hypothetical protein
VWEAYRDPKKRLLCTPVKSIGNYKSEVSVRAEGINAMWDTVFAYLISLGIIGAGVVWIVAGHWAPSAFGVIIGVPTIVVGLLSFFGERMN